MSRYVIAFAISLAFHGGLALLLATGLGASPSDQDETEQAHLDLAHVDLSFAQEEDPMAAPTAVEPEAAPPPRPAPQPQALPPPQTKLVEPEGLVSGTSIEEAVKPPTAQEIPPPLEVPPPSAPAEPAPQTAQVTAPPSLAQKLKFEYPPLSRRRNEEGTVVLDVEVGKDGTVGAVRIEKSSGFAGLDKAALNAAVKLRFNPAKRGAEPVEGHVHVPFEFRLKDN